MDCTIKDATVRGYYYDTYDQLRERLRLFLDAYDYPRRLRTLPGLTPYDSVCGARADEPHRFIREPTYNTPRPNV